MRISDWSSDVCSSDLFMQDPDVPAALTSADICGAKFKMMETSFFLARQTRSEERRVGKDVSVRVDLGGRRIIKKKKTIITNDPSRTQSQTQQKHNYMHQHIKFNKHRIKQKQQT